VPSVGWSHSSFTKIFAISKLKSLAIMWRFCIMLRLAILVQYRLVADGQTDRRKDTGRQIQGQPQHVRISMASRGKYYTQPKICSFRITQSNIAKDSSNSKHRCAIIHWPGLFRRNLWRRFSRSRLVGLAGQRMPEQSGRNCSCVDCLAAASRSGHDSNSCCKCIFTMLLTTTFKQSILA